MYVYFVLEEAELNIQLVTSTDLNLVSFFTVKYKIIWVYLISENNFTGAFQKSPTGIIKDNYILQFSVAAAFKA